MLAEAFAAVVAAFEETPRLQPLWEAVVPPEPQPDGCAARLPIGPHLSALFASGVFKWWPVVAEPPAFDAHGDFLVGFYSPHLALSRWISFRRIGMTVVDRAMILALASISWWKPLL